MQNSDIVSIAALAVSIMTGWSVLYTRQQDHEIQYLHEIEGRLYDAEMAEGRYACFWPGCYRDKLDCDEFATINAKTIGYLSLAVDFEKSIKEYRQTWCGKAALLNVSDCSLYSEYLMEIAKDPTGAFSTVRGVP